ncbi:MAG: 4Fe-4S binding protein [Actinobacteria bacterium]|nr:4Fe-4S binding protein [Actinomycetota bacterium]
MESVYEELRQHLDKQPIGAPESPEIIEILSTLFTSDEARLAASMPFRPKDPEEIAEKAGIPVDEAKTHLESMADKGLVFAREKDGKWGYALFSIMPGIFEFPYMKGKTRELKKLDPLWHRYLEKLGYERGGEGVTFSRIVPIQEEIEDNPGILTYDKVYDLIEKAEVVGIGNCACRTLEGNCNNPLEACMFFDDTCKYLVERGFGRYITKEEMKKKLQEFDELGLVHTVNDSQDNLQFVCNCCPCCCGFLRPLVKSDKPTWLAESGYQPEINEDECNGCGICEDRCPSSAMEVVDELAEADLDLCIGCGLCATGCPNDAIELIRREEPPVPIPTMREMGAKILMARGKLEDFLKANE